MFKSKLKKWPVHSSSGDTWNLNTTALKLLPMVDTL